MVNFDLTKKTDRTPEGEAVRLFLELTSSTISRMKREDPTDVNNLKLVRVDTTNPNYIGNIQSMTITELKNLNLKSEAQKQFIERLIHVKLGKLTIGEVEVDYLGEAGHHITNRTMEKVYDRIKNEME